MQGLGFVHRVFFVPLLISMAAGTALATATHPGEDPNFLILPDGRDLRSVVVSGSRLSVQQGSGRAFAQAQQAAYEKLKIATKTTPNHKLQWVLMDLDSHQVIDRSLSSSMKIFGASTSKIFVAGTLLNKQNGVLTAKQMQQMGDMIAVSSNTAWTSLQNQIGDGNDDRGRERINDFTQRMGYQRMRGWQGNWGALHGNELTADETTQFLYDTYQGNYAGSEVLWKYMHTCRTGAGRGRKYLPAGLFVGAKTGSYTGSSVDPETGKPAKVSIFNHALLFKVGGHQYGLTILSNTGNEEQTALMAGGLFREYTSGRFND